MNTTEAKPFNISKREVWEAFLRVKANAGAAGIDKVSIADFERNLKDNLYLLWNRMSSGSYFPPPVRAVAIPKKAGGERILGIPTVADRIAQTVVKSRLEPAVERIFHQDSYGYRPGKSAHQAIDVTRRRCWKHDWVLEFDIKGLFDNIDHDLLMKALRKHTDCRVTLLYVSRWLGASLVCEDGTTQARDKGTPQGGVISPILANLFMHYAFDVWMSREHSQAPFVRYADDGLVHCRTRAEAESIYLSLLKRLASCGLEMHPTKTKIVYCKDTDRRGDDRNVTFDFLGFTFRPRGSKNRFTGKLFTNFTPAVSQSAQKAMRNTIRTWGIRSRTDKSLLDLARMFNPILRGWISYYGKFYPSGLYPVLRYFNHTLRSWVMKKYRRFRNRKTQASKWLLEICKKQPKLFAHWNNGMNGSFG